MKLTVIIRNDAPMIFCGDSPSYRTVTFDLTEEQNKQIFLAHVGTNAGREVKEEISQCILE